MAKYLHPKINSNLCNIYFEQPQISRTVENPHTLTLLSGAHFFSISATVDNDNPDDISFSSINVRGTFTGNLLSIFTKFFLLSGYKHVLYPSNI